MINPKAEVVKTAKSSKISKGGMTSSKYSKSKPRLKDSILSSPSNKFKQSNQMNLSRQGFNNTSQMSSSKGLNSSRQSRQPSPDTTAKDISYLLKGDTEKSLTNMELNKTYQTILTVDPAARLKQKQPKTKASNKDAIPNDPNKIKFEEYVKPPAVQPLLPGLQIKIEEPRLHMMNQIKAREQRQKSVALFMTGLGREMEERRMKEHRDELKSKINSKVPKKPKIEDFLTNKVI